MAFFKKLKERMFRSSSKIDEGLDAIVQDGGEEEAVADVAVEAVDQVQNSVAAEPVDLKGEPGEAIPEPEPEPEPEPDPDPEPEPEEIEGTNDADELEGSEADSAIEALDGDDTVAGGLGNDIIDGGSGDDILRGDLNDSSPQDNIAGGDDIIFGGDGNDRIGGKSGNDILSGDAGDDFIWGDDGDDILMGVTGNDVLVGDNGSGGSGSDLFVFGNGDGTDTIVDFEVGIDRIGLVEGELTFEDLTITQDGNNALLGVTSSGETIAVLNGVQSSALGEDSFAVVPDVSNPDEAQNLLG